MEIIHKYNLTLRGSEIVVIYYGGRLRSLEVVNDSSEVFVHTLKGAVTILETELFTNVEGYEIKLRQLTVNTTNQKIALWCEFYKMRYGRAYKVAPSEASKVANIEFSQTLITLFFDTNEWWSKEKTIGRYCANYNELCRIEQSGGSVGKGKSQTRADYNDLAETLKRRFGT